MKIEDLNGKPYGEIVNRIAELTPQVEDAYQQYKALSAENRAYISARELLSAGLWAGDKVKCWIDGSGHTGQVVFCPVVGAAVQVEKKGRPAGAPKALFMFDSIEKADA